MPDLPSRLRLPLDRLHKPRILAVGLLVAVVGLVAAIVVVPIASRFGELREQIDQYRFRLERLQKVAAAKPVLLERLEKLKRVGQNDKHFLSKSTAALASADLQTMIKQTVGEAGGELTSTQVIPERSEDRYTRVTVKVRMNGSTEVLREVLYAFESNEPLLFIENLNIRPIRIARTAPAKKQSLPDRLIVDFDVVGYMRAE